MNDTKTAYLSDKITKCDSNPKLLHKLIDKLLVNQHQQQLPSHDNDELSANKFAEFFEDKIDQIRRNFTINNIDEIPLPLDTLCLDQFRPVSYDEVYQLITSYGNKSCELDSIPSQGWPVAFTSGICHRYLPEVAFTGIYKYFIDFSSNYIVDSPSYSLYCTWTP